MKTLLLIVLFISCYPTFSNPLCGSGTQELDHINFGHNTRLLACGRKSKNVITNLQILSTINKDTKILFEGDQAFKHYQLRKVKNSFSIKEGLKKVNPFNPFIEIKVTCAKGKCKKYDAICLWKKNSSNSVQMNQLLTAIEKKNCKETTAKIDRIFELALSGNKTASNYFLQINTGKNCNIGFTESFMIYTEDILRLGKLRCL